MCSPAIAVGVASIVATVASSAMSAYSQSQAMNYQSQVASNNQITANQNAKIALQQGQVAEQTQDIKTGEMIGAVKANEAASGVNPNTGSSLDVRSSAAETGEMDALTIRYNSNMQARNLQYQGAQYGAEAQMYGAEGNWAVANSILGGASNVSNKWLMYNQTGVPGFGNSDSGMLNPNSGGWGY